MTEQSPKTTEDTQTEAEAEAPAAPKTEAEAPAEAKPEDASEDAPADQADEAPATAGEAVGEEVDEPDINDLIDKDLSDPNATPAGAGVMPGKIPPRPPAAGAGGILFQFVIFPLFIVIIGVLIFAFFRWALADNRSYDEYLQTIASGWETKRWEALYQLQFRLTDKQDPMRKQINVPATIELFERAKTFSDPRVRAQLAVLMGHIEDPAAVPSLIEALQDKHPETRINAIFALGRIRSSDAIGPLITMAHPSANIADDMKASFYKVLAHSLGEIGSVGLETDRQGKQKQVKDTLIPPTASQRRDIAKALKQLLNNGSDDVRWNAALALARLGDRAGIPTFKAMLDRRNLNRIDKLSDKRKMLIMINAMRAIRLIKATELKAEVQAVSDSDPNLRVRQAAREILQFFEQSGAKKADSQK